MGGVIASHYRHVGNIDDPEYYTAIQEMHAVAAQGRPPPACELGLDPSPFRAGDWAWEQTHDRVQVRVGKVLGVFTRGMLCELTLTFEEWQTMARPGWYGGRSNASFRPIFPVIQS